MTDLKNLIWAIVALLAVLVVAYLIIKGAQLKEIQAQHNMRQERMESMQENQMLAKQAELGSTGRTFSQTFGIPANDHHYTQYTEDESSSYNPRAPDSRSSVITKELGCYSSTNQGQDGDFYIVPRP